MDEKELQLIEVESEQIRNRLDELFEILIHSYEEMDEKCSEILNNLKENENV